MVCIIKEEFCNVLYYSSHQEMNQKVRKRDKLLYYLKPAPILVHFEYEKKFIEIVPAATSLKPFIIQCKAFNQIFLQRLRRPDTELGASVQADPVSNRDDHIQAIVDYLAIFAVGGGCKEIQGNRFLD
jgi:hypothetical protein